MLRLLGGAYFRRMQTHRRKTARVKKLARLSGSLGLIVLRTRTRGGRFILMYLLRLAGEKESEMLLNQCVPQRQQRR